MNRTHLDFVDYLFPAIIMAAIVFFILVGCTGMGTCLVPEEDCSDWLAFYGEQMTIYGTAEDAESYPLPFGYWIESNTQRVLKLRAWDGSWARWSYSGDCELNSASGWVTIALSFLLTAIIALPLGFLASLLIPRKFIESLYVQM
ncbi:MAG: hypothetical protein J6B87_07895 [Clostridia bacterium]|nr:hypothetical protein [Clostridia bacterium]